MGSDALVSSPEENRKFMASVSECVNHHEADEARRSRTLRPPEGFRKLTVTELYELADIEACDPTVPPSSLE